MDCLCSCCSRQVFKITDPGADMSFLLGGSVSTWEEQLRKFRHLDRRTVLDQREALQHSQNTQRDDVPAGLGTPAPPPPGEAGRRRS